jgi:hypothetical protein
LVFTILSVSPKRKGIASASGSAPSRQIRNREAATTVVDGTLQPVLGQQTIVARIVDLRNQGKFLRAIRTALG